MLRKICFERCLKKNIFRKLYLHVLTNLKAPNLTKKLKVGPGYEAGTDCTPLISKNQLEKVV